MKAIMLLIVSFLGLNRIYGQAINTTGSRDSSNIYFHAFRYYSSDPSSIKAGVLLVEENNLTTESLPERLGKLKIEVINFSQIQEKVKNGKSLMLLRIVPMEIKEGRFFVNLIWFKVNRGRSGISYMNQGGSTVYFLYDCATGKFNLDEVIHSGI